MSTVVRANSDTARRIIYEGAVAAAQVDQIELLRVGMLNMAWVREIAVSMMIAHLSLRPNFHTLLESSGTSRVSFSGDLRPFGRM